MIFSCTIRKRWKLGKFIAPLIVDVERRGWPVNLRLLMIYIPLISRITVHWAPWELKIVELKTYHLCRNRWIFVSTPRTTSTIIIAMQNKKKKVNDAGTYCALRQYVQLYIHNIRMWRERMKEQAIVQYIHMHTHILYCLFNTLCCINIVFAPVLKCTLSSRSSYEWAHWGFRRGQQQRRKATTMTIYYNEKHEHIIINNTIYTNITEPPVSSACIII